MNSDYILDYLLTMIFRLSQQGDQLRARNAELERENTALKAELADRDRVPPNGTTAAVPVMAGP